jgi:PmbA protein
MTPEELQSVADRVVAMAAPGEQVEAVVAWSRDTEVRAYEGEVEHFVSADSAGVGVRVITEGRQGLSWAGVLDDAALAECLAEARDNAAFATADEHAGLAEPDGVAVPAVELYDPRLEQTDTDTKIRMAIELERLVRAGDPRMKGVESADYADAVSVSAIATTSGIRSAGAETSVYLGAYALAGDDEETTTGFGFSVARSVEGLDLSAAAADAVERSVRLLGAGKAPSERLTVVFDPYVTSQFLGLIAEMLSGEAVLKGRSPFGDRVGEQIAAPTMTLLDDAADASAPSASDTDGEGLACRTVPLFRDGMLQGFLHNSYTGRASGAASTGSAQRHSHRSVPGVGPHVVKLVPGTSTPEQVLEQVGDGLLVLEVSGLHSGVNPVSGDLSVGVEGLRIRGGETAEGVREVTIGSTLQRMLMDVVAVGSDLTYFPWESTGVTLAIADVTMSGQ